MLMSASCTMVNCFTAFLVMVVVVEWHMGWFGVG
jgi:hypothetical protein